MRYWNDRINQIKRESAKEAARHHFAILHPNWLIFSWLVYLKSVSSSSLFDTISNQRKGREASSKEMTKPDLIYRHFIRFLLQNCRVIVVHEKQDNYPNNYRRISSYSLLIKERWLKSADPSNPEFWWELNIKRWVDPKSFLKSFSRKECAYAFARSFWQMRNLRNRKEELEIFWEKIQSRKKNGN